MAMDRYISKIRMKAGFMDSRNLTDVVDMYYEGTKCPKPGYYTVEKLWNHLLKHPEEGIHVNAYPFPYLVPAITEEGQIFIRSTVEDGVYDFLWDLRVEELVD